MVLKASDEQSSTRSSTWKDLSLCQPLSRRARRFTDRVRRAKSLVLLVSVLLQLLVLPADGQRAVAANEIYVSFVPNRSSHIPLAGKILSGNLFVFITPSTRSARVKFFLDHPQALLEDPQVSGTPRSIDDEAPYDFAGTTADANRSAKPLDTRELSNGQHTITAALELADGSTKTVNARFVVHNGPPGLVFSSDPLKFNLRSGEHASKAISVFTSNGATTTSTVTSDTSWVTIRKEGGSTASTHVVSVDAAGLPPGQYTTMLTATAADYTSTSLPVTMAVNAAECSPVPCSEIKVALPYQLDFSRDHGKLLDATGIGTGFTYIDQPTNGVGYVPSKLAVVTSTPGMLKITTTSGIAATTVNSQDNALAVGIDAPSQISVLNTTLRNPPGGSGNFEQAGLWFGNDEDNYVKLVAISTSTGTKIQYLMEVNGTQAASKVTGALTLSSAVVSFSLRANPSDRTIAASYRINGGSSVVLDQFVAPSEFFSFDAAGIDPTIGTRSFGGIFATHRNGANALSYSFDDFSVVSEGAPPPPTGITFNRTSFPVPNPTSMVWGPDGRLYVTELYGKIHAITLNDAKQVVADQVITTLGSRLTLGITVDPLSTASNVVLWVSHSNASTSNGELNSSTITRLSGASLTTRQDIITGLPRAIANHAVNSLHFGPDGRLYIVVGGNTGAGAPNTANTEFGTRAEQPLSAALLVADVRATDFDGSCATTENTFGPSPCNVVPYATGLRNAYDFVWHSNGSLYAPDNGLGVTGTYPPTSTPPCTGYGTTTLWTQGGHNPGEQPDLLLRLEQSKYYGHPNPYRNECVFKDGSYQKVSPPSNYVAPIYNLGMNRSSNGMVEYKSDALGGTLKGELLIANYSVGDDITRVKLSADGRSVVEAKQLVGGFNNPLPLAEGPDGTIYVGEFGAGKVTALIPSTPPSNPGSWSLKQAMPAAVLDLAGTAIGDKLYAVGGKTSTGYQSTLYMYTPATNTWMTGPNLPGPAVENAAAAAYNGKLYVFGGSTAAFSGAVTNAAVYDPETSTWTSLAPMLSARGGATAQTINGEIYVVGGMDASGASVATVEVYNPASNSWRTNSSMNTRRDNSASATFGDGKLYVFGGRTRNADGSTINGTLATVEMYDTATQLWTTKAQMPTGRRTMVVGTINGRAQVMGGEITGTGGTFAQNEEYNPATNSWHTLAPMVTPRHGAVAGTINGIVYVAGGGPSGGTSFSTKNEAFSFGVSDTTAPTIVSTAPPAGSTGISISTNVLVQFSERMDPATLNTTTFTLVKQGTIAVPVAVSYDLASTSAILNPNSELEPGVTYTATVKGGTSGVKDESGNALAEDRTWSFTTAMAQEIVAPSNLAASRSGSPKAQRIDLTWTDRSGNEAKFVIERSTMSNFTSNILTYEVPANTVSYRDSSLLGKTTYYYRVFAVTSTGTRSAPSNTASVATK